MSRRPVLVTLSLLLLVLPRTALAQEMAPAPPRDEKPSPVVEKKAFDLLEAMSEQAMSLHAPSNRIRAESTIADLLWAHDEKRARALFKSASEELAAVVADLDLSDQEASQQLSWINQLRQEMVNRISARDPDLALAWLRATRVQGPADPRFKWNTEIDTSLEMHLALLIAKKDPARTLELARARLAQGVSYPLISLLGELQQKDPATAQKLYREMVDQIKSADLARNQDQANVAWNLLWFQPPQANEDTYRDLLGTLASAAIEITPTDQASINLAMNICNQLPSVMQQIEKYAPERAAALRQWSQNAERSFDPNTRMYQEINRVGQTGTIDDMIALALKYPEELRTQIYQQAAWKAFSNGDVTRARQIITDFVSDPAQRRQMLAQFDNQSLENAINEDKIAETRHLLKAIKGVDRRVQILARMANHLAAKGDKKGALELLNEAKALVYAAPPSMNQLSAQLELARSYASLDPDQSFAIVLPLLAKANELIAAATVLDGFDVRYLKDGEWLTPGMSGLGNLVSNLSQTLAMLARLDFDRARSMADQLERPELRLAADLDIARAALARVAILPGGRGTMFTGGMIIRD